MTDSRLVLPHDVEGVVLDVLRRRHPEHLAKLERQRNVPPRTYQPFQTMARMSDAAGERLSGDTVPALLIATLGLPDLDRNENDNLDATLQLGMQVTVMGTKRSDTILRRDAMAWTLVECMYQRLPRGSNGLINSVRLLDYEPLADADTQRTLGDARLIFEVGVVDMVSVTGFLPGDNRAWPAEAGGHPNDPYDPIPARPGADPKFTVDKRPLVE